MSCKKTSSLSKHLTIYAVLLSLSLSPSLPFSLCPFAVKGKDLLFDDDVSFEVFFRVLRGRLSSATRFQLSSTRMILINGTDDKRYFLSPLPSRSPLHTFLRARSNKAGTC